MTFYQKAQKEQQRLTALINTYNKACDALPEGKLTTGKNGNYHKFYLSRDGVRMYIPQAEKKLVEDLAKRAYLQAGIKDAQTELKAIDHYLKHHNENTCQKEMLSLQNGVSDVLKELLVPDQEQLKRWEEEDYPQYQGFPEMLIHKGPFGRMYRSKSEANIAFLLTQKKIPQRYEWERMINGVPYAIDFTTRHPLTGEFIYWEHLGKMDSASYIAKNGTKLLDYEAAGIFPGVNLILTFESKKFPLNISQLEEVIDQWYF